MYHGLHSDPETLDYEDKDISDPEIMQASPHRRRRSPIIVTISDPNIAHVDIHKMIENGANGIWVKTELSTRGDKIRMIGKVDKAVDFLAKKYGVVDWPVFTCVELKTCIVNTGLLEKDLDQVWIKEGTSVILTCDLRNYDKCNTKSIFVDNPFLAVETKVDTIINIDYEEIILRCQNIIDNTSIKCLVIKGGILKSIRPVCARGTEKKRPLISNKDLQIVTFALEQQIDVIIINYPRNAKTFIKVREFIAKTTNQRPILLGGICTAEGLRNIDGIIHKADGLVLSREFLAYELLNADIYRMMQIQKFVGAKCKQVGKPFYISGGIFAEALNSGRVLMNEIQNYTNSVLEEPTGYVLKSSPVTDRVVDVLKMMDDICQCNEPIASGKSQLWMIMSEAKMPINGAEAAALSCAMIANQLKARVIIIPTVTGKTAKTVLWFLPLCIVITVSTRVRCTRRLATYRCVVPLLYKGEIQKKWQNNQEARIAFAEAHAVKQGWLVYGDAYVTLQRGSEDSCFCDTVRIWKVAISNKPIVECPSDDDAYKQFIKEEAHKHL